MSDFSAERAVESAEALVRRAQVPAAPRPSRPVAPPSLPRGVTFRNQPIETAFSAPRWTLGLLIATAPWWLKVAWRVLMGALVLAMLLGMLTIIGLIGLLQLFWKH